MTKKYVVTMNGKVVDVLETIADDELEALKIAVQPLTIPHAYNFVAALAYLQHSLGVTCTVTVEDME